MEEDTSALNREYEKYLKSPYRRGPTLSLEGYLRAERRLKELHSEMDHTDGPAWDRLAEDEHRLCELMGW
jgi:hypothetical protein